MPILEPYGHNTRIFPQGARSRSPPVPHAPPAHQTGSSTSRNNTTHHATRLTRDSAHFDIASTSWIQPLSMTTPQITVPVSVFDSTSSFSFDNTVSHTCGSPPPPPRASCRTSFDANETQQTAASYLTPTRPCPRWYYTANGPTPQQ